MPDRMIDLKRGAEPANDGGPAMADSGASLVEYTMLLTFIVLAAFLAVKFYGVRLSEQYSTIASAMP